MRKSPEQPAHSNSTPSSEHHVDADRVRHALLGGIAMNDNDEVARARHALRESENKAVILREHDVSTGNYETQVDASGDAVRQSIRDTYALEAAIQKQADERSAEQRSIELGRKEHEAAEQYREGIRLRNPGASPDEVHQIYQDELADRKEANRRAQDERYDDHQRNSGNYETATDPGPYTGNEGYHRAAEIQRERDEAARLEPTAADRRADAAKESDLDAIGARFPHMNAQERHDAYNDLLADRARKRDDAQEEAYRLHQMNSGNYETAEGPKLRENVTAGETSDQANVVLKKMNLPFTFEEAEALSQRILDVTGDAMHEDRGNLVHYLSMFRESIRDYVRENEIDPDMREGEINFGSQRLKYVKDRIQEYAQKVATEMTRLEKKYSDEPIELRRAA